MRNNIAFYPMLSKDLLKKIQPKMGKMIAKYSTRFGTFDLTCNVEGIGANRIISIVDDAGKWSLDEHNLELSGRVTVHNTDALFGEKGVVNEDATLGVALIWKSRPSNVRGAKNIGMLTKGRGDVELNFDQAFEAARLRGHVNIALDLYVVNSGSGATNAIQGVSLGELDSFVIMLEGLGSTFTVFEKSEPGEPLWNVDCDWDDPEYSQFSECVKVTINVAHPAWVGASDEELRKELLKEIMASSMQIVMSELEPEQMDPYGEYELGSVCDAISYLVKKANLDIESNATIAKSMRAYLDKSMR